MIAPLSPHTQQFTPSVKKSIVEHPMDTLSFHHQQRTKIKSQKPVVKVVHDILTKKWFFIKRDKQLSALAEVARFLEALRLPP
jgi:hypothetical protein